MQKISCYLYPNRINLVADVTLFPVRWNIVYQNRVKIYQGVDNILTLDIKNAEQKRIDIRGMSLFMSITDIAGKEIVTIPVTPTTTQGLATVTITEDVLSNLDAQFLSFTVYQQNENSKTVLYADTQFGVRGNMELVGSALPVNTPIREINLFNTAAESLPPFTVHYNSECVDITLPNFIGPKESDVVTLDFEFTGLDATVNVQLTKSTVIGHQSKWDTIETFTVTPSTSTLRKTYTYPVYNREYAWLRITYIKVDEKASGSIDRVRVTL